MGIVLRLIILTLGVFVAAYVAPGINVEGYWPAIKAAILLGVINTFIKPVIIILTLPITVLTMGLFTVIINALILWFVGSVIAGFHVAGFLTALLGAVIISLISAVLNRLV